MQKRNNYHHTNCVPVYIFVCVCVCACFVFCFVSGFPFPLHLRSPLNVSSYDMNVVAAVFFYRLNLFALWNSDKKMRI